MASSLSSTSAFIDLNPVRVIKKELHEDDHIIAIMGPTGAGKSSFIAAATGRDLGVGHSLQSHTSQLTAFRVKRGENYVVLVDTPGSDDTNLSDYDILQKVFKWLHEVPDGFTKPPELCGILYLHRISDNRMGGTTLKNLDLFQKLLGKDRFERVILTTTMWPEDQSDFYDAFRRQEELRDDYWKFMIDKGSRVEPFSGTQASAWSILDNLVKENRRAIQIQKELSKSWKDVPDTKAGKQLQRFNGTVIQQQKVALRQLLDEIGKTTDQEIKDVLVKEWLSLREEQEKAARVNQRLDSWVGRRFIKNFVPRNSRATAQFPYEDRCLDLISDILKNDEQRYRIYTRTGDDAKTMYHFLCQVSSRDAFKEERTVSPLNDLERRLEEKNPTLHHENSQDGLSDKYENVYNILLDIISNDNASPPDSDGTRYDTINPVRIIKEELDVNDHIVAIMGPTGAGKSSFIAAATGRDFGVCHSLQSHSSQIAAIRVKRGENYVVLVDMPGFDDTYLSDYDTLRMISDWLREIPDGSTKPLKLCGILYLHRISDNRMGGATLKNLEMFQKLCGKDRFERVILTTTMWPEDSSDVEDARKREEELCNDYWKLMMDKGSITRPFDGTQASAWSILDNLVKKRKQAIQIQKELKKPWKDVLDTTAGKQLQRFNGSTTDQEIKDVLVKKWLSQRENAARDQQNRRTIAQFSYEDRCLDLISDILKNNGQRCKISKLSGDDAKTMYDFLRQISSRDKKSQMPHHENSQDGSSESIVEVKYENVYKILLDIIRNNTAAPFSCAGTRNADVHPTKYMMTSKDYISKLYSIPSIVSAGSPLSTVLLHKL
ncbi:hypothetical protein Agabi119p4_5866 [Agaricus bisporus var. burnettii]|uniref:G domain-containing protein n=1 Tax=Agaricus bisporus var. burnettii TaxID=192524 RepID=A0A8H7KFL4_AGABI|nr:hypothetical protein Agabi119p4_5866 [Agaricus bisporus var. burnettii]